MSARGSSPWTPPVVLGVGLAVYGAAWLAYAFFVDKLTGPTLAMGLVMVGAGMWMVDPGRTGGFFDRAEAAAAYLPLPGAERAGRRDTDPIAVPEPVAAAVTRDLARVDVKRAIAARQREIAEGRRTAPKRKARKVAAKKTTRTRRAE